MREHLATCPDAHAEMAELGSRAAGAGRQRAGRRAAGGLKGGSWPPRQPTLPRAAGRQPRRRRAGHARRARRARRGRRSTVPRPRPETAEAARAARPARSARGRCASPPCSRSSRSVRWNLLLQQPARQRAQAYEQSVAAVLDVAAQPGSLTAILTADGGDGPAGLAAVARPGHGPHRDAGPRADQRQPGLRGVGHRQRRRARSRSAASRSDRPGTATSRAAACRRASGIVLALTLEPGPGATTPTMPIISKGVATAAG